MPADESILPRAARTVRLKRFGWRGWILGLSGMLLVLGLAVYGARVPLAKWVEMRFRIGLAKQGLFYSYDRAEVQPWGILVVNPALYGDAGWDRPLARWRGDVRVEVPWGQMLTRGSKVDVRVQSGDAVLTFYGGAIGPKDLQDCGVDLLVGGDRKVTLKQAGGRVADLQLTVSGEWWREQNGRSSGPPDFSMVHKLWPWLQWRSVDPAEVSRLAVVLSPGGGPDKSGVAGRVELAGRDFQWGGMAVTECSGRAHFLPGRVELESFYLAGKSGEVRAEGFFDEARGELGIGRLDSTLDPLSLASMSGGPVPEFLKVLTTTAPPHLQGEDLVIHVSDPALSRGRLVSATPWKMDLRTGQGEEASVEPVTVTELEVAMVDRKLKVPPVKLALLGGEAEVTAEWDAGPRWRESAVRGSLSLTYQGRSGQAVGRLELATGQLHLESVESRLDLIGWYKRIPGMPATGFSGGEVLEFTGSDVLWDFRKPEPGRGKVQFERGGVAFTKEDGEHYDFGEIAGGLRFAEGKWQMEDLQFNLSGYWHVLKGTLRTGAGDNIYSGAYAAIREGRRMDITGEWDVENDRGKFETFSSGLDIIEWLARMPFTAGSEGVIKARSRWEFTEPPRVAAENVVLDVHRPELNNIEGRFMDRGIVRLKPVAGGKGFPIQTFPLTFSMHEGVVRSEDLDFESLGARWKGAWRSVAVGNGPSEYRFAVDQAGRKAEIDLVVNEADSDLFVRKLESGVDFLDMLRRMPEPELGVLRGIRPMTPPRLSLAPFHINLKDPAAGTYQFKLEEGLDFDWVREGRVLPVRGLIGNFRWEDGKLEARGAEAMVFGGKTQADFVVEPRRKGTPLLGSFSTAGMSVPQLYLFLNKPEPGEARGGRGGAGRRVPKQARGILDAVYKGRGGSEPGQFTGEGSFSISEGMYYSLPLLGPLDLLFETIFPTYRLDPAKDLRAEFAIADGIAESREFRINGRTTTITGEGVVDFNKDTIDARFRGNLRGVAGVLTSPLSKILEVKVEGKLNDRQQGLRYLRVPGGSGLAGEKRGDD